MSVPPTPRKKPGTEGIAPGVPSAEADERHTGLAIASLVLGILGILTSILVIGGVLALVGLILGAIDLARKNARKAVAGWGVGLSIVAVLISILCGIGYFAFYGLVRQSVGEAWDLDVSGPNAEEWSGVMAPDFTVTTLDGDTLTLSELRGKRVIVDFWATWCGPCVMEIPHFVQLAKEIPSDDLVIIGISDEDPEDLRLFARGNEINYAIASAELDDRPYSEIVSIPTTFFIDRKGVIQEILEGYHDYDSLKSYATASDYDGPLKFAPGKAELSVETGPAEYE